MYSIPQLGAGGVFWHGGTSPGWPGFGDRDAHARRQGGACGHGSRSPGDQLRVRLHHHSARLRHRQSLGLPHQPGGHLRSRGDQALSLEGGAGILGGSVRWCHPRRLGDLGRLRGERGHLRNGPDPFRCGRVEQLLPAGGARRGAGHWASTVRDPRHRRRPLGRRPAGGRRHRWCGGWDHPGLRTRHRCIAQPGSRVRP